MKFKLPKNSKAVEIAKLVLTILLFVSMAALFVRYAQIKLGSLGIPEINSVAAFPTDKMWVFTENSYRASANESDSPYIFPTSITFRADSVTRSVTRQKSVIISVYNDLVQYVSEVLSQRYTAEKIEYAEYTELLESGDYVILSYDADISAYILRLYCDRAADGFYIGAAFDLKKLLLTADENERLIAYAVNSENEAVSFVPLDNAGATAYPINSAVISAYTNSKILIPSVMAFESDYFSERENVASDIAFIPNMQFYEAGIANPLDFINQLTTEDSLIKNDRILSILKSFKINTGLVRHYIDGNVIHFVESSASLAMSGDGYIDYNSEDGGIPLSKILDRGSGEFTIADKLTAATTLVGGFGNDIIGGGGEVMLTRVSYDAQSDIMKFEFTYCFDSIPFCNLEKLTLEIGKTAVVRAHIPTYSFYRNSVRKISLISPEVSLSATEIVEGEFVNDCKIGYVVSSGGSTATVGWIAVT